jgi:hypothetical protein
MSRKSQKRPRVITNRKQKLTPDSRTTSRDRTGRRKPTSGDCSTDSGMEAASAKVRTPRERPQLAVKSGGTADDLILQMAKTRSGAVLAHTRIFSAQIFEALLRLPIGTSKGLSAAARKYAMSFQDRLGQGDPLEEILVQHLLWTHARATQLSHLTAQAASLPTLEMLSAATDRTMNTLRRLVGAIDEHRHGPSSVTRIAQANIANQQVVMNATHAETQKSTNEQGCGADKHASGYSSADRTTSLQPQQCGTAGAARCRTPQSAMVIESRANNT